MFIGCCTTVVDNARIARDRGADFIEVGLNNVMAMPDDAFNEWSAALAAAGVTVRASNAFMPADIKVVGPDVDQARVDDYVTRATKRMQRLGVRVAVFGSSGSRNIPEGFDPARARKQLAAFLTSTARALDAADIQLALEPLCAAESNLVNTVGDALALVREAAPGARVLADFFHMSQEGEPLDVLEDAGDLLAHVHVSTVDRRGPVASDADAGRFVQRLREIGYTGGCSLECGWADFPVQIGASLAALRQWAA